LKSKLLPGNIETIASVQIRDIRPEFPRYYRDPWSGPGGQMLRSDLATKPPGLSALQLQRASPGRMAGRAKREERITENTLIRLAIGGFRAPHPGPAAS
jgi:hypothetical protein